MAFGDRHWEWIFWQNAALTPVMMLLTAVAMPHRHALLGFPLATPLENQDNSIGFGSHTDAA